MTDSDNSNDSVRSGKRHLPQSPLALIAALMLILLGVVIKWESVVVLWSPAAENTSGVRPGLSELPFEHDPETQIDSLTIATWNINYNNQDLAEVTRLLQDCDADIICLQETTEHSESWLKQQLGQRYPSQFTAGHTGRFLAEGFMVLSRRPLLHPRFVPPVRTFFGHVVFEIMHLGQPVTVISVHLTPFATQGSRSVPELISILGQTESAHRDEVQAILQDLPPDRPVLIAGDFNSPSHGVAPTTLAASGLQDLFVQVHADPDQTHKSWDFRLRNGLHATWRIDYLFYSRHFTPLAAELVPCHSSDHHLLIGRLECRPQQVIPDAASSASGRSP